MSTRPAPAPALELSWPCESHRLLLGGTAYGLVAAGARPAVMAEQLERELRRWLGSCSACQQLAQEAGS